MSAVTSTIRVVASLRGAFATLLLFLSGSLIALGVAPLASVTASTIVGLQVLCGVLTWRAITGDSDLGTSLAMGMAIGLGICAFAAAIAVFMDLQPWVILVPSVVVLLSAAAIRLLRLTGSAATTGSTPPNPRRDLDSAEICGYGISVLLISGLMFVNIQNYPLDWMGSWTRYHPDMTFFGAISSSIPDGAAGVGIFTPGGEIRYHWLAYSWAGQIAVLAGLDQFAVLTRVVPLIALLGSSLLVVSWTRRVSTVVWLPSAAVVLLLVGGFVGMTYGGVFNFDSPSQSMGVLWLICFCFLGLWFIEARSTNSSVMIVGQIILIGILAFVLVGTKVSAALPGLGGLGLLFVVGLFFHKRWWRKSAIALVTASTGMSLAFFAFLSGSNGGGGLAFASLVDRIASQQGMNPLDGSRGVVLGTAVATIAIFSRWIGLFWLSSSSETRLRPITILGWGLAISSLAALWLFNSFNELWFSTAASGPLSVVCALGLAGAVTYLRQHSARRFAIAIPLFVAAALGVYAAVWLLWLSGPSGGNIFVPTVRWMGPLVGVVLSVVAGGAVGIWITRRCKSTVLLAGFVIVLTIVAIPGRALGFGTGLVGQLTNGIRSEWFTTGQEHLIRGLDTNFVSDWTSTRVEAGQWLRTRSDSYDIVATNVTLDAFVPAVTHLQTFVSGIHYQGPYGPPELEPMLLERERESWAFIDTPSAETVKPLCDADVKWLWIDTERTARRNWEPWASIEFSRPDVLIARINSSACP